MKLFTVKLADEHRAKLEALRVSMGLRSESDVIRALIDGAVGRSEPAQQSLRKVEVVPLSAKAPFKSRLKGEWKAP